MPDAETGSAARSACGHGDMDDDDHVLRCVACNIARWNEVRRDKRLRRHPKPWPRRLLNRAMRAVVLGDPRLLPPTGEVLGRVE